jgi:hypothetical protein
LKIAKKLLNYYKEQKVDRKNSLKKLTNKTLDRLRGSKNHPQVKPTRKPSKTFLSQIKETDLGQDDSSQQVLPSISTVMSSQEDGKARHHTLDANTKRQILDIIKNQENLISRVKNAALGGSLDHFKFEGFDYKTVIFEMAARSTLWQDDLPSLLAIGLMRANIHKDGLARTSEAGQKQITELATRYGIKIRDKNQTVKLQNHTITFTRIVACFPLLSAHLLHEHERTRVEPKDYNDKHELGVNKLPAAMRFPGFSSLLRASWQKSHKESHDTLYLACCAFTHCFLDTIQPTKAITPDMVSQNMKVSLWKAEITDDEAKNNFETFGIMTNWAVVDSVKHVAENYKKLKEKK